MAQVHDIIVSDKSINSRPVDRDRETAGTNVAKEDDNLIQDIRLIAECASHPRVNIPRALTKTHCDG